MQSPIFSKKTAGIKDIKPQKWTCRDKLKTTLNGFNCLIISVLYPDKISAKPVIYSHLSNTPSCSVNLSHSQYL